MKRVILESPYVGDVEENIAYARAAVRDCLARGEAPIASHLLYTLPGILDDGVAGERALGIAAGHAWMAQAELMVVYRDRGVSGGMTHAIALAEMRGLPIEYRNIAGASK